jgi:predicted DNA-binding protein with PD1-like motif
VSLRAPEGDCLSGRLADAQVLIFEEVVVIRAVGHSRQGVVFAAAGVSD